MLTPYLQSFSLCQRSPLFSRIAPQWMPIVLAATLNIEYFDQTLECKKHSVLERPVFRTSWFQSLPTSNCWSLISQYFKLLRKQTEVRSLFAKTCVWFDQAFPVGLESWSLPRSSYPYSSSPSQQPSPTILFHIHPSFSSQTTAWLSSASFLLLQKWSVSIWPRERYSRTTTICSCWWIQKFSYRFCCQLKPSCFWTGPNWNLRCCTSSKPWLLFKDIWRRLSQLLCLLCHTMSTAHHTDKSAYLTEPKSSSSSGWSRFIYSYPNFSVGRPRFLRNLFWELECPEQGGFVLPCRKIYCCFTWEDFLFFSVRDKKFYFQ